jgi:hypothetical protein
MLLLFWICMSKLSTQEIVTTVIYLQILTIRVADGKKHYHEILSKPTYTHVVKYVRLMYIQFFKVSNSLNHQIFIKLW